MKKKTTLNKLGIIILIITVAVISILSIRQVEVETAHKDMLSQEEIDDLRKKYPINDNLPELREMTTLPLEELVRLFDCFVEVEIVGEPTVYTHSLTIDPDSPEGKLHDKAGGRTEFTYIKHEVHVINDIFDCVSADTIEIMHSEDLVACIPTMDVGARFLVGGVYDEENEMLGISNGQAMFYITENDYVLSVKSEESKNRHTGSTVEDLIDYIKAEKGY